MPPVAKLDEPSTWHDKAAAAAPTCITSAVQNPSQIRPLPNIEPTRVAAVHKEQSAAGDTQPAEQLLTDLDVLKRRVAALEQTSAVGSCMKAILARIQQLELQLRR